MTDDPKLPESSREWLCRWCGAGSLVLDPAPEIDGYYLWRCGDCREPAEIPVYGDIAPAGAVEPAWHRQIDMALLALVVRELLDQQDPEVRAELEAMIPLDDIVVAPDEDPDWVTVSILGNTFGRVHKSRLIR
jgi:hypothetical protein